jgi:hypothetical protein
VRARAGFGPPLTDHSARSRASPMPSGPSNPSSGNPATASGGGRIRLICSMPPSPVVQPNSNFASAIVVLPIVA